MTRPSLLLVLGLALSGCPGFGGSSGPGAGGIGLGGEGAPHGCQHPEHVVDGLFTGWDGTADGLHEWSCVEPLVGFYTSIYIDYEGGRLMCLNDWHLNSDGPIEPDCYNLFVFDVGNHHYELRVYGDQHTDVLRDGEPFATEVEGAAGFGVSPALPTSPHSIFEFTVALPDKGAFRLQASDPKGPVGCDTDDRLVQEPTIVKGVLDPDQRFAPDTSVEGPVITGAWPGTVRAGDLVTLEGERFGVQGSVVIGPFVVAAVSWSDRQVQVTLPADLSGAVLVAVQAVSGTSAPVQLLVRCEAACDGKACGADGCGGTCGTCSVNETCQLGACVCAPDCAGRSCGPDGCGGSCGGCEGPQLACVEGACVCQPACAGRACGDDGCGGSCGACAEGEACDGGQCVCEPQCDGKECGDDGCGGTCGTCPEGQECAKNDRCTAP